MHHIGFAKMAMRRAAGPDIGMSDIVHSDSSRQGIVDFSPVTRRSWSASVKGGKAPIVVRRNRSLDEGGRRAFSVVRRPKKNISLGLL